MPQTQDKTQLRLQKLLDNLSQDFTLDKLSKSPARFNLEKLNWFNRQYIQMMTLEEFAYRAAELKLQNSFKNKNTPQPPKLGGEQGAFSEQSENSLNLRVGDYVYLVDIDQQKVFAIIHKDKPSPIGGGRNEGETGEMSAIREIQEETMGKIQLDPNKLIKICAFAATEKGQFEKEGIIYDGKEIHSYFYPLSMQEINDYEFEGNKYAWVDLAELIGKNNYLTFPIWQNFCLENDLVCFEPNEQILQQYLAWNLDKNRVTTLSEVG